MSEFLSWVLCIMRVLRETPRAREVNKCKMRKWLSCEQNAERRKERECTICFIKSLREAYVYEKEECFAEEWSWAEERRREWEWKRFLMREVQVSVKRRQRCRVLRKCTREERAWESRERERDSLSDIITILLLSIIILFTILLLLLFMSFSYYSYPVPCLLR